MRFQTKKTPERCASIARLFDESLVSAPDAEASKRLPELIEAFLDRIGLNQKLGALGVKKEEQEKIANHFLLGVLPFGTKEELTGILMEAF